MQANYTFVDAIVFLLLFHGLAFRVVLFLVVGVGSHGMLLLV